jgi:hypothetical protein
MASLVLAAAGFAAEPPPAGQSIHRVAPPGSRPPAKGGEPAPTGRSRAPRRTLREVVNAIEQAHGVRIWLDPAVSGATPSDVDPTGLPVEVSLQQAFQHYHLFLHYRPDAKTGALKVTRAWAFPRDRGERVRVEEPAETLPAPESGDPAQEALALHGLSAHPGRDATEVLLNALSDPDETVRQRALLAVQASGLPLPAEAIHNLVLYDASEGVRMTAMDLLPMAPDADPGAVRALLERIAQDPSQTIRDHAAALLSTLVTDPADAALTEAVPDADTVMRDLEAGDDDARLQALATAQSHGIHVSPERLEDILKHDASEELRVMALNALANNAEIDPETVQAVLEWAARDPSPLVRDQATALLGLNPPTDTPDDTPLDIPLEEPEDPAP